MQVNKVNSYQQNFQGLQFHDGVTDVLKKRVKTSELQMLQGIISEIKNNKQVDAVVYLAGGKNSEKLGANISPNKIIDGVNSDYVNEGLLYKFKNPIAFFNSVRNKVNKMTNKIENTIYKNKVIDNFTK